MTRPKQETIVIIGAGVIGLQTALTLLSSQRPPQIFIVASQFPGSLHEHYTSPWAGGQWRTHASPDTKAGKEECEWDLETYHYWDSLVTSERLILGEDDGLPKIGPSGIGRLKSRYFWDEMTAEIAPLNGKGEVGDGLWWRKSVRDFRVLGREERPEGSVFGVEWTSFCVDVPRYLLYLVEEIEKRGGVCIQTTLPTGSLSRTIAAARQVVASYSKAPTEKIDLFINATGLTAQKICADTAVFPTRGQTILVKGELPYTQTRKGKEGITYTIPRPGSGTTILGGVNEMGNWDTGVDERQHGEILRRAKGLARDLLDGGEFLVLGRQVGLRPGRKGGARVEVERVGGEVVLHCYGHGGAGYQNSIGCARKVERMVRGEFGVSSLRAKL